MSVGRDRHRSLRARAVYGGSRGGQRVQDGLGGVSVRVAQTIAQHGDLWREPLGEGGVGAGRGSVVGRLQHVHVTRDALLKSLDRRIPREQERVLPIRHEYHDAVVVRVIVGGALPWPQHVDRVAVPRCDPPSGVRLVYPQVLGGNCLEEARVGVRGVIAPRSPHGAYVVCANHVGKAADVVRVGMRLDQPVDARPFVPGERGGHRLPALAARVDDHGPAIGKLDHGGVALTHVQVANDEPSPGVVVALLARGPARLRARGLGRPPAGFALLPAVLASRGASLVRPRVRLRGGLACRGGLCARAHPCRGGRGRAEDACAGKKDGQDAIGQCRHGPSRSRRDAKETLHRWCVLVGVCHASPCPAREEPHPRAERDHADDGHDRYEDRYGGNGEKCREASLEATPRPTP